MLAKIYVQCTSDISSLQGHKLSISLTGVQTVGIRANFDSISEHLKGSD